MKYVLPETETDRLKFRLLAEADFDKWLPLFKETSVLDFFGMDGNLPPETHCRNWFNKIQHRYDNDLGGLNVLIHKASGDFIGQCGLLIQTVEGEEYMEIGYSILPEHWGKGYATEAAQKCRDLAFENNFSDEIISIVHIENHRSANVARKNGMKVIRQARFHDMPVNLFGITKAEWQKLR